MLKKKVEHQEIIDGDDDEKIDISIEHFEAVMTLFGIIQKYESYVFLVNGVILFEKKNIIIRLAPPVSVD